MTRNPLPTERQRQVLQVIDKYVNKHGQGPSYRDLVEPLGVSILSVVQVIRKLKVNEHVFSRSATIDRGAGSGKHPGGKRWYLTVKGREWL